MIVLPPLPFPPSVNTYYRSVKGRMLISARGRAYRNEVVGAVVKNGLVEQILGPVKFSAVFHQPDKRKRDIDNLFKGLLDSLKYAGCYLDDSQVHHLDARWGRSGEGQPGSVAVILEVLEVPSIFPVILPAKTPKRTRKRAS